jgi:hypothetical protein
MRLGSLRGRFGKKPVSACFCEAFPKASRSLPGYSGVRSKEERGRERSKDERRKDQGPKRKEGLIT